MIFFLFLVTSIYIFGEGNGTPLQYSSLENPMDGGAWWAAVHGVTRSRTWLSDFPFTFHFHALEKEMATHCSGLAWRIPGTAEPGGLPSMGSHRVGHDWSDLAAAAAGWALVQCDLCPYKKRWGNTERHQECMETEERFHKDRARTWLSARQGERLQKEKNLLTP